MPVPTNKYSEIAEYESKKPSSYYVSYEEKVETKKPASAFEYKQVSNPYSSYTNSIGYSESNKIASNAQAFSNYKPPSPVQPIQMPNIPYGSTKNPYNLNVSLEFTNSFTMKVMA